MQSQFKRGQFKQIQSKGYGFSKKKKKNQKDMECDQYLLPNSSKKHNIYYQIPSVCTT